MCSVVAELSHLGEGSCTRLIVVKSVVGAENKFSFNLLVNSIFSLCSSLCFCLVHGAGVAVQFFFYPLTLSMPLWWSEKSNVLHARPDGNTGSNGQRLLRMIIVFLEPALEPLPFNFQPWEYSMARSYGCLGAMLPGNGSHCSAGKCTLSKPHKLTCLKKARQVCMRNRNGEYGRLQRLRRFLQNNNLLGG